MILGTLDKVLVIVFLDFEINMQLSNSYCEQHCVWMEKTDFS